MTGLRWRGVAVAAVLALAVAAPPGPVRAAEPAQDGPTEPDRATRPCVPLKPRETVLVDLQDAPLGEVARLVSCAAERNIVFSPAALAGRQVTVISARPVDRRGLLGLWQALLAENGLVAEGHGAYAVVRAARP